MLRPYDKTYFSMITQSKSKFHFKFGELFLGIHSWLVYLFLYLPIIVLIVFSFSKSRGSSLSETLFSFDSSEYQSEFDKTTISDKLRAEFNAKQYPLSEYATLSIQKQEKKWQIIDKAIFNIKQNYQTQWALNHNTITADLRQQFRSNNVKLSDVLTVIVDKSDNEWTIKDKKHIYEISKENNEFTILTDKDINYIARNTKGIIQVSLWYGFSLDWYKKLFTDREIFGPTKNSLIVAVVSTIISTILGTMIAFAMSRYSFPGKKLYDMILYMPIIIPDIVMGISLLTFYVFIHFTLGLISITIAHVAFNISYVAVVVRARLHGYDKALDEAAMDLGANPFQTFMKVTFPIIAPGVIGGALIAFTLSLDDYLITSLVAGTGSTTLPVKVYSMMKFGVTPEINALSTLILLFTMILILTSQRLGVSGGKIWRE
jgi:spermidine/putrescine transport system permease protein